MKVRQCLNIFSVSMCHCFQDLCLLLCNWNLHCLRPVNLHLSRSSSSSSSSAPLSRFVPTGRKQWRFIETETFICWNWNISLRSWRSFYRGRNCVFCICSIFRTGRGPTRLVALNILLVTWHRLIFILSLKMRLQVDTKSRKNPELIP